MSHQPESGKRKIDAFPYIARVVFFISVVAPTINGYASFLPSVSSKVSVVNNEIDRLALYFGYISKRSLLLIFYLVLMLIAHSTMSYFYTGKLFAFSRALEFARLYPMKIFLIGTLPSRLQSINRFFLRLNAKMLETSSNKIRGVPLKTLESKYYKHITRVMLSILATYVLFLSIFTIVIISTIMFFLLLPVIVIIMYLLLIFLETITYMYVPFFLATALVSLLEILSNPLVDRWYTALSSMASS